MVQIEKKVAAGSRFYVWGSEEEARISEGLNEGFTGVRNSYLLPLRSASVFLRRAFHLIKIKAPRPIYTGMDTIVP